MMNKRTIASSYGKIATKQQRETINNMLDSIGIENMNGRIPLSRNVENTVKFDISRTDAIAIIDNNVELLEQYRNVCTYKMYKELERIAGRKPKQARINISKSQAMNWINEYSKKPSKAS